MWGRILHGPGVHAACPRPGEKRGRGARARAALIHHDLSITGGGNAPAQQDFRIQCGKRAGLRIQMLRAWGTRTCSGTHVSTRRHVGLPVHVLVVKRQGCARGDPLSLPLTPGSRVKEGGREGKGVGKHAPMMKQNSVGPFFCMTSPPSCIEVRSSTTQPTGVPCNRQRAPPHAQRTLRQLRRVTQPCRPTVAKTTRQRLQRIHSAPSCAPPRPGCGRGPKLRHGASVAGPAAVPQRVCSAYRGSLESECECVCVCERKRGGGCIIAAPRETVKAFGTQQDER